MKLDTYIIFLSLLCCLTGCTKAKETQGFDKETAKEALQFATQQYEKMMKVVPYQLLAHQ